MARRPRPDAHDGRGAAWLLWLAAAAVWGMALLAVDLPGGRLAYATGLTVLMLGAATATRLILTRR